MHVADGSGLPITHTGTSLLKFPARNFVLSDVLCVPSARQNLLSVSKFTQANNVSIEFFSSHFLVKDRLTGAPLAKGPCHDGVYHIFPSIEPSACLKTASLGVRTSSPSWHARLGHPSLETNTSIINAFKLPVMNKSQILGNDCVSCHLSKSRRLPFHRTSFTALHPLHYVYADVWGPRPSYLWMTRNIIYSLLIFLHDIVGFIH